MPPSVRTRLKHLLYRAAGGENVFDEQDVLAGDQLFVAALDDELVTVLFGVDCQHFIAVKYGEPVRGPLCKDDAALFRTDDDLDVAALEVLGEAPAKERRFLGVNIEGIFVDVCRTVSGRRVDEVVVRAYGVHLSQDFQCIGVDGFYCDTHWDTASFRY